jgi:hypothetical protein
MAQPVYDDIGDCFHVDSRLACSYHKVELCAIQHVRESSGPVASSRPHCL